MSDFASKEVRSKIMRSVGREDTGAERACEELLQPFEGTWLRHPKELPGRPDFYFPKVPLALFIHGCFWHGHEACPRRLKRPKTHAEYWRRKIDGNRTRDRRVARQLRSMGIAVYVVWECQVRSGRLPARVARALAGKGGEAAAE